MNLRGSGNARQAKEHNQQKQIKNPYKVMIVHVAGFRSYPGNYMILHIISCGQADIAETDLQEENGDCQILSLKNGSITKCGSDISSFGLLSTHSQICFFKEYEKYLISVMPGFNI